MYVESCREIAREKSHVHTLQRSQAMRDEIRSCDRHQDIWHQTPAAHKFLISAHQVWGSCDAKEAFC